MIIFSDCKINIGLNILRRRADGYHDIDTCMVPIPWHDIIEILPAKGAESTLTVLGNPVDCPPEKNLVMKALRKLQSQYGVPEVDVILQKIVPDGAGLGGGSSDASHMLTGLNHMFDLGLSKQRLAEIAAQIGADCPLFIYDEPMMATGIGEILEPIDIKQRLRGYTILIIKPLGVNISTKEAYAGVKPTMPATPLRELLQLPIDQWQGMVKNDFEDSIFALAPVIRDLKQHLIDSEAIYASMSGSGASVYGIFASDKLAEKALLPIKELPHHLYKVE